MKSKKKSIKAAIYIRVSTVEQSDNNFSSLDGQLNQCKTWINQRNTIQSADGKKIEVHGIYKDTKSGKDLNRPGIERLMKDAKSGQFDLLVVTKIDRVSRSLKDFLNFFEKLESCNIDIASVTQEIDTSTSAGKRSEEHTSELQSRGHLVCRLLLEKKNRKNTPPPTAT